MMRLLQEFINHLIESRHGESLPWLTMTKKFESLVSQVEKLDGVLSVSTSLSDIKDDLDSGLKSDYVEEMYGPSVHLVVSFDENADVNKIRGLVNDYAERRGWYLGHFARESENEILLVVSPHRIVRPQGYGKDDNQEGLYYHITTLGRLPTILKKGLIPSKSNISSRVYPARVYLFSNLNDVWDSWKYGGPQAIRDSHQDDKKHRLVLLTIDASKLRRGTKFQWDYAQSQSPGSTGAAYFTYTHIPPTAIIRAEIMNDDATLGSIEDLK